MLNRYFENFKTGCLTFNSALAESRFYLVLICFSFFPGLLDLVAIRFKFLMM